MECTRYFVKLKFLSFLFLTTLWLWKTMHRKVTNKNYLHNGHIYLIVHLLWFLILLSCALLIPFRISLFINSMLCWCNVLCVVCSAFVWASQLKSHYLCPEIGNNSDFFSWWWWWWWRWWWLILFNVSHYFSFYLFVLTCSTNQTQL